MGGASALTRCLQPEVAVPSPACAGGLATASGAAMCRNQNLTPSRVTDGRRGAHAAEGGADGSDPAAYRGGGRLERRRACLARYYLGAGRSTSPAGPRSATPRGAQ